MKRNLHRVLELVVLYFDIDEYMVVGSAWGDSDEEDDGFSKRRKVRGRMRYANRRG